MRAGQADPSPAPRGWVDDGPPAAVGLLWVDGEAAITDADGAACELLGYPREELVRLHLGDVDVELVPERWPRHLEEIARRGTLVLESRLRTRAGALVPVEVTAFPGPPGAGPCAGLLLRDLGERRQQQGDELAARRRLAAMLDAIPDPLFEVDLEGRYHAVHAGDDPLLARPASELLGRTLREVLPPAAAATCEAALDEAERGGRSRGHRFELDLPMGRRCFELSVARRSTLAGEEPRFIVLSRDVTERQHTEAALLESRNLLRSVIDNAPLRVFWKDRELRYLGCNPAFARDAGHERPEDVVGRDDFSMAWSAQAERYQADDLAVIESGQARIAYDEPQSSAGGQEVWLQTSKVPLRDAGGEIIGLLGIYQDITERKRVERRLAMALEASQLVPWDFDVASDHLAYDASLLPRLGLEDNEAPRTMGSWLAHVHPDDREAVSSAFLATLRPGGPDLDIEYRLNEGAAAQWVRTTARVAHCDEHGAPLLAVGTSMNINARRLVEEARRQSDERARQLGAMLRRMCDNVPDMIWAKDLDKRFVFANKALCERLLCAHDTDEPIGKNDVFFALRERGSHPDRSDWHTFGELCQDSDVVTLERGAPSVFEEFGNIRGQLLYLDVHKAPFHDEAGAVIGTVGSARDVTDRVHTLSALRESEERFRDLANTAPMLVWMLDAEHGCTWVNQRWLDFTGRLLEDELGEGWADSIHPDDRARAREALAAAVAQRQPLTLEYRGLRHDGAVRSLLNQVVPRVDAAGRFAGHVGSCLDITVRKEAERAQIAAREAAEAANRAKSEFLANMSHELRTPLNGVLGNIQLLQMTQVDERQRQYLADIALSGKSLLSLINDILDLSKIEAQKVVPTRERFSLRTAINNSAWMHRARAAEKGLTLEILLHGGLPDLVLGDELRVKQILSNLIGNALKFTARGGVTVAARLLERAGDAAMVELTVTDTGIGVAPELREAIFQPFVQADSSITRRYGGTGLGLTISRRLAELMGGRISLESEEGVGSAFRVVLPLAVEPGGASAEAGTEPAGTPLWTGPPLHVLLAEDDPVSRIFEVAVLVRMGHRVTAVADGHEALAALGREAFDLVLLDIQMPLLDGRKVLATLRAGERGSGAHLPAVAVTAFASREEERLLASEFDAYVRKPVEVAQLALAMRRALAAGKERP